MGRPATVLNGKKFGALTVIRQVPTPKSQKNACYEVKCDLCEQVSVKLKHAITREPKSCGRDCNPLTEPTDLLLGDG